LAVWWMLPVAKPEASTAAERPPETMHGAGTVNMTNRDNAIFPSQAGATNAGEPPAAQELRAYTAALTAQGVPEKTVRERVASRITAVFESRRMAIRNQSRRAGADLSAIETQLNAVGREQGALIAQLVGAEETQPAAQIAVQTKPGDPAASASS